MVTIQDGRPLHAERTHLSPFECEERATAPASCDSSACKNSGPDLHEARKAQGRRGKRALFRSVRASIMYVAETPRSTPRARPIAYRRRRSGARWKEDDRLFGASCGASADHPL